MQNINHMKKENQHFDVIIMGAGLSGIGAACHLQRNCPTKSYIVIEARNSMGGTWDLFRYPGIRSDTDMYTLGYNFKPWTNPKSIADGGSILSYIKETAQEYSVDENIQYNTKIEEVHWDSKAKIWTVKCKNSVTKKAIDFSCNYLESCLGYYKYEHGFTPDFKGIEQYKGKVIHPQLWPEDLDYSNKEIVVIGSGATAITLVPAMAEKAKHVTMLQRSPSYLISVPNRSLFPKAMSDNLPSMVMHHLNRSIYVGIGMLQFSLSRSQPNMMKNFFISNVNKQLPSNYDTKTNFTPNYKPWDERLCVVPDGDLFKAIKKGKVTVVTDHIDTFTKDGILLKSGKTLKADIIITATGLQVQMFGGAKSFIDDKESNTGDAIVYKGMMIKDLPNFVFVVGYTNASWTLKADLASNYFCRLINATEKKGKKIFVAQSDKPIKKEPILDFSSGYVKRAIENGQLPQQGSKEPWKLKQNYIYDSIQLGFGSLNDGYLKMY